MEKYVCCETLLKLNCELVIFCSYFFMLLSVLLLLSSNSGQLKLILARLSNRPMSEASDRSVKSANDPNVLRHRGEVDNLPDSTEEKVPMQTLQCSVCGGTARRKKNLQQG